MDECLMDATQVGIHQSRNVTWEAKGALCLHERRRGHDRNMQELPAILMHISATTITDRSSIECIAIQSSTPTLTLLLGDSDTTGSQRGVLQPTEQTLRSPDRLKITHISNRPWYLAIHVLVITLTILTASDPAPQSSLGYDINN